MSDLREHLIVMHAETSENLDAMIAETIKEMGAATNPSYPKTTEGWLEYIHQRQHESGDWEAGHDEDDESTALDWEPNPGHHPGQRHADITYVQAEHKGMDCELYNPKPGRWEWSFYDDDSPDPETAVARGEAENREDAERELREYIDGYINEDRGTQ